MWSLFLWQEALLKCYTASQRRSEIGIGVCWGVQGASLGLCELLSFSGFLRQLRTGNVVLKKGNRKVLKMFYVGPDWKPCFVPTLWGRAQALLWGLWVVISVHTLGLQEVEIFCWDSRSKRACLASRPWSSHNFLSLVHWLKPWGMKGGAWREGHQVFFFRGLGTWVEECVMATHTWKQRCCFLEALRGVVGPLAVPLCVGMAGLSLRMHCGSWLSITWKEKGCPSVVLRRVHHCGGWALIFAEHPLCAVYHTNWLSYALYYTSSQG